MLVVVPGNMAKLRNLCRYFLDLADRSLIRALRRTEKACVDNMAKKIMSMSILRWLKRIGWETRTTRLLWRSMDRRNESFSRRRCVDYSVAFCVRSRIIEEACSSVMATWPDKTFHRGKIECVNLIVLIDGKFPTRWGLPSCQLRTRPFRSRIFIPVILKETLAGR